MIKNGLSAFEWGDAVEIVDETGTARSLKSEEGLRSNNVLIVNDGIGCWCTKFQVVKLDMSGMMQQMIQVSREAGPAKAVEMKL